ncbi:hypothetical protein CJ205_06105 [Dolosicoccus paucivorans]|uniref:PepSY domain-containing protein n=1 Tax=Dolosicoccus paucivorans TaxID=84521 RepID=A0A2N6SM26_9LACT|nr:PepSY domain-containing protein [Dolosicoccus paucivorans]PMB84357.1 hypothetical protein CJ206_04260 [Dolosicoccus paucivorans]PMC58106.1 hypothetical protein CJ205_06105 [Dolosicoccus paucivorans]
MKNTVKYLGLALLTSSALTLSPLAFAEESSTVETSTEQAATEQSAVISFEDALKVYKEKYPDTDLESVKLKQDKGRWIYDFDGIDDMSEYSLKIDAETKEIIKEKVKELDKDEQNGVEREKEKINLDGIVSKEEAEKIAKEEAGADAGEIEKWELDRDGELTVWEIKFKNAGTETKVKIDAHDKKVLKVDLDD